MSQKLRMPSIAYVVARSWPDGVIGNNNELPWRLPSDLKRFRAITTGHAIIMGRKTFESIGRPLPNRMNIVLSRQPGNDSDNLKWVNNFENAMFSADIYSIINSLKEFFIIGGSNMYELYGNFVNKIYLTQVHAQIIGDAYFKMDFPPKQWRTVECQSFKEENDQFRYDFSILERRIKVTRQRDISEFYKSDGYAENFIRNYIEAERPRVSGMEFRLRRRIDSVNELAEALQSYGKRGRGEL
jgi:dihydrofolate reductase